MIQEFRKMNKLERVAFFAEYCKDPDHFQYVKGGLLIFDNKVQEMVCIMMNLRSRKSRIVKKIVKKFFHRAIYAGIKASKEMEDVA